MNMLVNSYGVRHWCKLHTFTSRALGVLRVTGQTAGAHGGTVGSAIGTGFRNAVGTRARVRWL